MDLNWPRTDVSSTALLVRETQRAGPRVTRSLAEAWPSRHGGHLGWSRQDACQQVHHLGLCVVGVDTMGLYVHYLGDRAGARHGKLLTTLPTSWGLRAGGPARSSDPQCGVQLPSASGRMQQPQPGMMSQAPERGGLPSGLSSWTRATRVQGDPGHLTWPLPARSVPTAAAAGCLSRWPPRGPASHWLTHCPVEVPQAQCLEQE